MTPLFEVHVTSLTPTLCLVELHGEQDIAASEELHGQMAALAHRDGDVIVDLTATTFIDSIAFAEIITARQELERAGRRMVLVVTPGGAATAILDIADADRRIFTSYETREAAVRALTASA